MIPESDFIGYVHEPDVHDVILRVRDNGELVGVLVKAYDGRLYALEFQGVQSLKAHRPEGMILYALIEMEAAPPSRRFVFADWEGSGGRYLEVTAEVMKSDEVAGEDAL
jgi:hypothetical protein